MSSNLYWAYIRAWQEEKPASKYNLSPGAALMLRSIIDAINAKFWPDLGIRIDNQYFYDVCNLKNRYAVKRCRDELIKAGLISWHQNNAQKDKSGFYQLKWFPDRVSMALSEQVKEDCCKYATPAPFKLRTINGS